MAGGRDVSSREPNPVAHLEGRTLLMVGVVELLVFRLSMLQVLLDALVDGAVLFDKSFRDWVDRDPFVVEHFQLASWIEPIVSEERRDLGGSMLSIVIREFREGKYVEPVVLLVVAKGSQILFHDLIDTFRLAVRLRVKGCRLVTFDIPKFVEPRGKVRSELSSSI